MEYYEDPRWFQKPRNWDEVRSNLEIWKEYYDRRMNELVKAYPEERKKALSELETLIKQLRWLIDSVKKFNRTFFQDDNNKISKLGMVGRWYRTTVAEMCLEEALMNLKLVEKSLKGVW